MSEPSDSEWIEHPEARLEFLDALEHYQDVAGDLIAQQLIAARLSARDLVELFPEGLPPYTRVPADPTIRHLGVGKFPYRLIYQPRSGGIWVLAYAHEKRYPGYWADRLKDAPPF